MSIPRRLSAIERRRGGTGAQMSVVMIHGGLPDEDDMRACVPGGREWLADVGERPEAFRQRVTAEAVSEGASQLVFGGLPD